MLEEQRTKLENWQSEYISIGISKGGDRPVGTIRIPWEQTSHAFNMKTPDIFISPEDLSDKELMDKIKSYNVIGCYIFTQLDDYSFIAELPNVRDIYIIDGVNIKDLSFLSNLKEWRMLHIERAHLKDLNPIYRSTLYKRLWPGFCLSFAGCTVDDVSALYGVKQISELIVIGEDDDTERTKWKNVKADIHRYYTIKK